MKSANTLAPQRSNASFGTIINSQGMRSLIDKTLGDPVRAARLVSTLISTVSASEKLQKCSADSVVAAALKGEGMNLSLALGQYSIVPYGEVATYITSYKGYIQLAMRSGLYEDLDAIEIREGEYKGRDHRTGKPRIDFIESDEERENTPIIGYYAFFLLRDGFFRCVYWTRDKVLKHADRYSKAFDMDKYNELLDGKLTDEEKSRLSSPWYDTDGQQELMCKKTVLRNLLNSGYAPLSIEMQNAMTIDDQAEAPRVENDFFSGVQPVPVADLPEAATPEGTVTEASQEPASTVAPIEQEKSRGCKKNAAEETRAINASFFGAQ